MNPRRLFVAGATGAVGRTLVPLALQAGLEVVPHVRPRSASKLIHPAAVVMELDDPRLPGAMTGCTTVIQLIGTIKAIISLASSFGASSARSSP